MLRRTRSREKLHSALAAYVRTPHLSGTVVIGKASARGEWPRATGRHAIDARPTPASGPPGRLHRHDHHRAAQEGPAQRLDARHAAAAARPAARLVGRAFTLRFVPAREDLATPESWASPISTRAAIEAMPAGCIAVVDAMGVTDAGIFGDILCARMHKRGVAALVTDGVVRDLAGVLGTGLPVWCQRLGRAALRRRPHLRRLAGADRLRRRRRVSRRRDRGRRGRRGGDPGRAARRRAGGGAGAGAARGLDHGRGRARRRRLPGLYPPNAETKARYEAFRASR